MDKKKKESSMTLIFFIMIGSLLVASFWDKLIFIKKSVNFVLNPSAGALLNWNLDLGMIIIVLILTAITVLIQKYSTDQETLKKLKKEQKELQKEMKKYKEHPEKILELQKKSFESMPKMMKLSMRGTIFTILPLVFLFRWFGDYFFSIGNPHFFGTTWMSWIWAYIILSLIFSSILRKIFNVV